MKKMRILYIRLYALILFILVVLCVLTNIIKPSDYYGSEIVYQGISKAAIIGSVKRGRWYGEEASILIKVYNYKGNEKKYIWFCTGDVEPIRNFGCNRFDNKVAKVVVREKYPDRIKELTINDKIIIEKVEENEGVEKFAQILAKAQPYIASFLFLNALFWLLYFIKHSSNKGE